MDRWWLRTVRHRVLGLALGLVLGIVPGAVAQDPPEKVGKWSDLMPWPNVAIHMHVLPNGKVLTWPRMGANDKPTSPKPLNGKENLPRLWDPADPARFGDVGRAGHNLFCAGHAFMGDGRLLVAGGHIFDGQGDRRATIYDPGKNTWAPLPDMNHGRWYPTVVTLGNGEMLVLSGSYHTADGQFHFNRTPQVLRGGAWRNLPEATPDLAYYPYLHVAPNGKVFLAGAQRTTMYLDTSGNGRWERVAERTGPRNEYGASVMYDVGKVLVLGGGIPPLKRAEVIDLQANPPRWRQVDDMAFARRHLNATILPDGTVLVTGGTSKGQPGHNQDLAFNDASGAVLESELWDPGTEKWTRLAPQAEKRLYHSTAVLLPDGRVLSAGGGQPHAPNEKFDHLNAQIYSPPYLFKGDRPTITEAPADVTYGSTFRVKTPAPDQIKGVTWVRLSATTHAFNQNQRFNRLEFETKDDGLDVKAPADGNLAPPGHYMLFLLNPKGVPSVARIIRIHPAGA